MVYLSRLCPLSPYSPVFSKSAENGKIDIEKLKKITTNIEQITVRISPIISGLRNISRDASNEPFANFTLAEILNDVLPLVFEKFKNHKIEIKIDLKSIANNTKFSCLRTQLSH